MSDELIQVAHLSRDYGRVRALNDVSFNLHRGDILGFLGPNGAGKSTTMQILSGNLSPTAGSVLINGTDILGDPRRAKSQIGYLPEQPPLYRELTVDEFLAHCARLRKIPRSQKRKSLDQAKERTGLSEVGNRLIGNLSKGYQQRVGIAQAILHTPAVVILDEPTVGLDPIQIREIRSLIRDIGKEHSVILSTHILPEVQSVCNRVQIIHHGSIVFSETTQRLEESARATSFVAAFHRPPESLSPLTSLPEIQAVERLDQSRFRFSHAPQHTPTERVVEESVKQHWGLYELMPEHRTLEQIFVELTTSELPLSQGKASLTYNPKEGILA